MYFHGLQMNMRGVFLHVAADALGSVIVIVSALIVHFVDSPKTEYVDPALSVIMVLLLMRSVWPLRKPIVRIRTEYYNTCYSETNR